MTYRYCLLFVFDFFLILVMNGLLIHVLVVKFVEM